SIMLCLVLVMGTVASISVFAEEPETAAETLVEEETTTPESTAAEADTEANAAASEEASEVSSESASEEASEAASEVSSEVSSEPASEEASEADSEAASENVTEAVTEAASEEDTEIANDSVTDVANEASENSSEATIETNETNITSENSTEANTEDETSAAAVQEMIDALPSVNELSDMTTEEQLEVYYATQEADEAYQALSDEEKESVDDSLLDELFDYFNGEMTTTADYTVEVAVNETYTLTEGTSLTSGDWSSNNSSVATVDNSNSTVTITGVAAGTATITHTYYSYWGQSTDTYNVTVTDDSSGTEESDETYITVYLYVQVSGDTDVDTSEWTLNGSGWYTIGYIQIPTSILSSDVHTNHTIEYTFSSTDMAAVVDYVNSNSDSIILWGKNTITRGQIVNSVNWTAFKLCDGANNYVDSGIPAYHLDGTLILSATQVTHTLIYDDNVNDDSVSKMPNPDTETVTDYVTTHNFAITETVPVRDGYAFVEWNTEPDGSGTSYAYGSSITVEDTETLYAIWVKTVALNVKKVVSGTTADTAKKFEFTVVYGDGTADIFELSDGESYNSFSQTELTVGSSVTLTESENTGYAVTVFYNGSNVTQNSDGSFTFTLAEGVTDVTVTNTTTTTDITIQKIIKGNMGDTSKKFSFTVTDEDGNNYDDFTLGNTDIKTISGVTIGSKLIITENSYSPYDVTATYDGVSITDINEGSFTVEVTDGGAIVVTNTYKVNPDTGIDLDSAPYIAILFGVMLFGTAFLIRRRRRLL
ncbi:MAG: InlB B-repeat-containing protein, partial [Clostridiales bacterium]|nr:InlB B-repeat-containing protein [Clostridiales bacterium]